MRNQARLATVVFDLEADEEEKSNSYDIDREDKDDILRREYQLYLARIAPRLLIVEQD